MKNNKSTLLILVLSVLLFCGTASHSPAAQPGTKNEGPGTAAQRPNILFIAVDDKFPNFSVTHGDKSIAPPQGT